MSRRKQTKPFKVEEKEELKREKNLRSRRSVRESESAEKLNEVDISEGDDDATVRTRSYAKCDECGKTLASSLSLARHKLTHSENKPYRCPRCNAGFKTSSNMHRHVRIHFRDDGTDQMDPEPIISKSHQSISNQRSSRQNIRAPNKFREFDVDLVRVGPRSSESNSPRSHTKPKRIKEEFDAEIRDSMKKPKDDRDEDQGDYNSLSDSEPPPRAEDLMCHICSKTFISKFGLQTHMVIHNEHEDKSNPLRCHLCDQSFTSKRGLTMHNVVEHKISKEKVNVKVREDLFQKMAKLDFSALKFPHLAEKACTMLKPRTSINDSDHIFICKKCDVSFPMLEALQIHIRDWHTQKRMKRMEETVFSCVNLAKNEDMDILKVSKDELEIINGKDDDIMYTSKLLSIKLIPKWLQNHPDDNPTAYDKEPTDEMTPYASKLMLFDDDVSAEDNTPTKNAKDTLSTSTIKRKLRNQVDSSSILRRFECTVPRKIDVNKMPGEKNVFWCKICNYSSHEKSALVRHLLTHSGIRPYFCKVCDYAFTTKANCERHVRKRHNCVSREELDAAVRCDWELLKKAPREDIYMISASNSSCPVCQKSFSCNNELKLHMKSHEERHFVCQLCGVRCTTRNNCVRHILHKHPGIPHQEANNIITFCGNGPNDLDLDIEAMTTDATEDSSDVDISRGRLSARGNTKQTTQWKKPSHQRRPDSRQSLPKRPRLEEPNTSKGIPESDSRKSSNQEDESKIDDDNTSNAGTRKSNNIIPLIPLLKIKAYNEAAAKSYARMVTLYEHLSFLNPIEQNSELLNNVAAVLNQTVDEGGDETYFTSETSFICRTCAKAFDSKELLEIHVPQCEYIVNDEVADRYQDPHDMDFGSQENENIHPDENDEEYNGNLVDDEWDQQNVEDLSNHMANGTVENLKNSDFVNWQETADETSSFNAKSSEESISAQEYDSAYGSDKLRGGTYGKEPSYVEDSLLMSMFGGEEGAESKGKSGNIISSASKPRYSSDLPTMVGMTGGSVSKVNYQGALDVEDKPSAKRNFHGRQCPQCNKTFPWASSLRRHIMTHTGLKLYMCRVCKMRFTTRSNLIRHVYRRHGMAKQHPDFASCLAKLNPSDSLLREVEADVRRRIDKKKRIPGTRNAYERLELDDEQDEESTSGKKIGIRFNNFQSMLEDDPDTMLVDLDYSPRDELNGFDEPKQFSNNGDQQDEAESQEEEYEDKEEEDVRSNTAAVKNEPEEENVCSKGITDPETGVGNEYNNEMTEDPSEDADFDPKTEKKQAKSSKNSRNKQSSHFVCGLCKKIFKIVDELITHLDVHNIPHCWHCPICRVPFTNKYNCQRHLSRRHARADLEPRYVEDSKHGPRNARGLPKSRRSSPDWKPKRGNAQAV